MQQYTAWPLPPVHRRSVLALGNFDGVHQGHKAVLAAARELARHHDAPCGVMTFDPHPRQYFAPAQPPFRLMHPQLQQEAFAAAGMNFSLVAAFDKTLADTSAADFGRLLAEDLQVTGVVCGYDFVFGCKRTGNAKFLQALGEQHGFAVRITPPCYADEAHLYSSSAIRHALRDGRPEQAARLLGTPWTVLGTVIPGAQKGRSIGFPTANIDWQAFPYLHPRRGVYAVEASLDARQWWPGVANIGVRPTVDAGEMLLLEVHLLDRQQDIYGQTLRVRFHAFLRPEQRFESLAALQQAIAQDCHTARQKLLRQ